MKAIYQPSEKEPFFSLDAEWAWNYFYAFKYTSEEKLVLDAGCGVGYGTEELAKRSFFALGIDLSKRVIDKAMRRRKTNLRFILADCRYLPLRNESFDLITSFEVIEHLVDPDLFLKEVKRVLKENGKLILSTPIRRFEIPLAPLHKQEFTPKELETLLHSHFADVRVEAKTILDANWRQKQRSFIGRTLRKLRKSYFGSILAGLYDLYLNPAKFRLESFCVSNDFENASSILAVMQK